MPLILFEGAAGTGKTTRLFGAAQKFLQDHPLSEGQRVLALTKHHGSRKRLVDRLTGPSGLGAPVDCITLDSFALNLAQRWRSMVRHLGVVPKPGDFDAIALAAASVLEVAAGAWVARRYPLVLVDEMQDCREANTKLLAALEPHVTIIAGADNFQDLNDCGENKALKWASSLGQSTPLSKIHRTNRSGILEAAQALRSGTSLRLSTQRGSGFEIMSARSPYVAGATVSWRILSWSSAGQIAVISPVKRASSHFIDRLTTWMGEHPAKTRTKSGATAGPYRLRWEDSDKDAAQRLLTNLGLDGKGAAAVSCAKLETLGMQAAVPELTEWARRRRFLKGRESVTLEEMKETLHQIVRRRRVFNDHNRGRLHALTVHQAKNREFESVVVLWPIQVASVDVEMQRRLLYNAITRAKRNVIVIVDDPDGHRLQRPPFTVM